MIIILLGLVIECLILIILMSWFVMESIQHEIYSLLDGVRDADNHILLLKFIKPLKTNLDSIGSINTYMAYIFTRSTFKLIALRKMVDDIFLQLHSDATQDIESIIKGLPKLPRWYLALVYKPEFSKILVWVSVLLSIGIFSVYSSQ